jgi:hypothetical protein
MGLGAAFINDLIELKQLGLPAGRKLIEIGAQQLAQSLFEPQALRQLENLYGAHLTDIGQPSSDFRNAPLSGRFWRAIGFDYTTIDLDGSPEAVPIDLNKGLAPSKMRGAIDLIVNTGTTEHITNQENAFRVIHDFARPGAIMYHEVPGGGHSLNHGFFSYTPKFFLWLADTNNYEIIMFKVAACGTSPVANWVRNIVGDKGDIDMLETVNVQDISLRIALRKKKDIEFATPLDIPMSRLASICQNPEHAVRRRIRWAMRGW